MVFRLMKIIKIYKFYIISMKKYLEMKVLLFFLCFVNKFYHITYYMSFCKVLQCVNCRCGDNILENLFCFLPLIH